VLAADALHHGGDAWVLQVELMPGQAVGYGEGRQPAAQGADLQGGGHGGQVAADRLRGRRQGYQALAAAPGGEASSVAGIALSGRGGGGAGRVVCGAGEGIVAQGEVVFGGDGEAAAGDQEAPLASDKRFYRKSE
jgi:hypothetical protein